ncbi:NUDIX hydrolase [Enterovibrio nigricans]|uniref:8-oxo-dGTP pyrophosphatase MutT, NUDIX family n=1 Tax=Enterovibrio nigricans DSM 22720 TaxID=1121868 RepID=A0A1T4UY36_9GAMM|nr:CoA pyrophosphatase [Enterovibrio nigricans]PKF50767.1 CoA pyrophosphatase [Enterovibrio nigricans]SKA57597.1 8-oxo-dGTP pyrophosphatase MutT, NUDIX family [Enterovibrio nigricans DSM 22720]
MSGTDTNFISKNGQLASEKRQCPMRPLSRHWLTQRFSLSPAYHYDKKVIQRATDAMKRHDDMHFRPAAVTIALAERNGELHVLFTKRARHLKHHPSQISFPGGKVEKSDRDIVETAVREMEEEIGIVAKREDLLGRLSPLPTVSGYLVTPVIMFVDADYTPTLDSNEVDSLFEVPLAQFMRRDAITKQPFLVRGNTYHIYAMGCGEHLIWGVTAQILHALSQQLSLN